MFKDDPPILSRAAEEAAAEARLRPQQRRQLANAIRSLQALSKHTGGPVECEDDLLATALLAVYLVAGDPNIDRLSCRRESFGLWDRLH